MFANAHPYAEAMALLAYCDAADELKNVTENRRTGITMITTWEDPFGNKPFADTSGLRYLAHTQKPIVRLIS